MIMDQGQMGREAFVIVDGDVVVRRNGRKVATLGRRQRRRRDVAARQGPAHRHRRVRDRLHAARDRSAPVPRRHRLDSVDLAQADGEPRRPHPRARPPVLRLTRCLRSWSNGHELRRTPRRLATRARHAAPHRHARRGPGPAAGHRPLRADAAPRRLRHAAVRRRPPPRARRRRFAVRRERADRDRRRHCGDNRGAHDRGIDHRVAVCCVRVRSRLPTSGSASDTPPLGDVDEMLLLDSSATTVVGDWYALGQRAMDVALASLPDPQASIVRLWPEHFDVGADLAVNSQRQAGCPHEPRRVSRRRVPPGAVPLRRSVGTRTTGPRRVLERPVRSRAELRRTRRRREPLGGRHRVLPPRHRLPALTRPTRARARGDDGRGNGRGTYRRVALGPS